MLLTKINTLTKDFLNRSSSYFEIGKDIFNYGKDKIMTRFEVKKNREETTQANNDQGRQKVIPPGQNINKEGEIDQLSRRQESMKNSQGVVDHSGLTHHGPDKPGEKTNSNMWQRNFENHQGN